HGNHRHLQAPEEQAEGAEVRLGPAGQPGVRDAAGRSLLQAAHPGDPERYRQRRIPLLIPRVTTQTKKASLTARLFCLSFPLVGACLASDPAQRAGKTFACKASSYKTQHDKSVSVQ